MTMSIYQTITFYYCSGENLVLHPCSGYTSKRRLAKLCRRGRCVIATFATVRHVLVLQITNTWGYFNVIRDIETCRSALIRLGSAKIEAGSQTDFLRIHLFLHVTALRLVTSYQRVWLWCLHLLCLNIPRNEFVFYEEAAYFCFIKGNFMRQKMQCVTTTLLLNESDSGMELLAMWNGNNSNNGCTSNYNNCVSSGVIFLFMCWLNRLMAN